MGMKKKTFIGAVMLAGILAIGQNVDAAGFESRLIKQTGLSLGGAEIIKGTSYSTMVVSTESSQQGNLPFYTNPASSKRLTETWGNEEVTHTLNLFCEDKGIQIGSVNGGSVLYTGDRFHPDQSNIYNWILSEQENNREEFLTEGHVQKTIWYLLGDEDYNTKTALYLEAEKYDEYIKNRTTPTFKATNASKVEPYGSGLKAGPFKVSYYSTYYGDTKFGNITGIQIIDANGKEVPSSDWTLMSEAGGAISTPTSGLNFYIYFKTMNIVGPVNVKFSFNVVEATSNYVNLSGQIHVGANSYTGYCDDCKPYSSYTIIDGVATEQATAWGSCGNNATVVCPMGCVHQVFCSCNSTHTTSGNSEGNSEGNGTCSKQGWGTYTKHVHACGCGKFVRVNHFTHIKTGADGINSFYCGNTVSWEDHDVPSQPLMCGWGTRTNSAGILSAEIELNSVDLSLRKFITAVNGVAVSTSRVPSCNTTALNSNNNKTPATATYTHTKTPVDVARGDIVTYTIRVYNEGSDVVSYAKEIKDYLPDYLEYVNNSFNQSYGWSASGNVVTTSYLADKPINAYVINSGTLSYQDVKIQCKVSDSAPRNQEMVNNAEISKYAVSQGGTYTEIGLDRDSTPNNISSASEDDNDYEVVKLTYIEDLALRKFITDVNGAAPTVNDVTSNRVPSYNASVLNSGQNRNPATATYSHPKDPVDVARGDIVTYTIRIYNEGSDLNAYAREIKDYLPEYLEYVDNEFNRSRGWSASGKVVTTRGLENVKINKYVIGSNTLSYADIQIQCRVSDSTPQNEVVINNAEISKYGHEQTNGNIYEIGWDRDSTGNNISTKHEDDDDYEQVKLMYVADLALRKFITAVNNGEPTIDETVTVRTPAVDPSVLNSGKNRTPATATYTHTKDPVDVKRGDIVTYTIRIYNEGSDLIAYAREIKDYLPDYLEYVDNEFNRSRGWSANGKTVTTRGLQNTEIAKYVIGSNTLSSADIQIQCKVATNTPYYQLIVNKAEISVYGHKQQNGNIYESNRDRDSRGNNIDLNNYNPPADNSKYQEDDDDYEQVKLMLTDFYGTVWIDGLETKQEERDGILTSNDAPYAGARVILHDNSKNDKQRETYTNEYGKYKFERLLIEDIYYTTFEYSGQEYIPVAVTELNSGNYTSVNSAGAERGTARADLNAKFYEIEQGAAVNKNNASRVTLEYAHIAEGDVRESLINKGTQEFINASKIQAHTVNFKGNADYANYINLGLIERAQVDLGLMTDISQVDLTINGERATYNWGERSEDTAFDMAAKLKDLDRVYKQMVYTSDYNFRIEDYKDYEGKLDPTRTPEIELQAYITYKVMVKNTSSKSASLSKLNIYYDNYAFEYFNKTYDNHNENISDLKTNHSWYVKGSSQGTVVWQNTKQDAFTGYNEMSTSSTKNIVLEPNESVYIYVRFQAKKHTEGTRVREFTPNERYIVAEIAAYTTDDGLIDIDSQPDNVSLSKPWDSYMATMEDDTCRSPGFIIPDPESSDPGTSKERQMTGFVFEDSLTTEDDGIRHGDGIYNPSNGDRLENDVTVQLVEIVNVNGTDYEYIWQETKTGSKTAKYMSKAGGLYSNKPEKNLGEVGLGYYKFAEYIPGNYVVRFKYGDNIVGQQVVLSGQDYKSTTNRGFGNNQSCADDNMFRRYEVMKYSEVQSFVKSAILSNDLNQIKLMTKKDIENYLSTAPTTEITAVKQTDAAGEIDVIGTALKILRYNTWMNANTSIFKVTINQTSPGSSINFGVEPRPIAELEAIKTIEDIKITNKGIIILDSEMGIGQEVTKERVQAFQMDDELINGAVVSVKYNIQIKNVGEKDNLYNYFKGNTLGKADLNVNQKETSKTTALLVFDYPQNIGYSEEVQENKDNWKKATEEDKQKLSQMVQGVIRTGQNIMTIQPTNNILYQELSINEETNTIPVILSRIISVQSNDNLVYNNMVEIIMAKNTVGRRAEKSVFGNYKPINTSNSLKTNPTEPDSDATTVTIINPQGKKFNPHYEIWIISLSLLIGGIIIIKKTVLNKRNSF